ncbi:MAG TPA: indole-3-glycerol phosphate synthase TrpC [Gemmataceae bacterium]|nr:indole-3-glycerol phosphate synthase TrpC [Gemmataceae bacterium]
MATILDTIVESKWREIAAAKQRVPEAELERQLATAPLVRDFEGALRRPGMQIIAEVKKVSPSAGVIRADFDPVRIAQIYEQHGAACISVLTDEPFFQGNLNHLTRIRESTTRPLLRKDFILDRYQLLEARVVGADCALLIAEILPGERLQQLHDDARSLGLHVLVELHDAEQLPRVIDAGATLIGINNRDLRHFTTRLEHTLELSAKIPKHYCLVSESGIRTHADLQRLEAAGAKAVLVGESLLREKDIGAKLEELRGVGAD